MRSVLFQVPGAAANPSTCFTFSPTPPAPDCFTRRRRPRCDRRRARPRPPDAALQRHAPGVRLAAASRRSSRSPAKSTESLGGMSINDPHILDFVALFDADGNPLPLGNSEDAVRGRPAHDARGPAQGRSTARSTTSTRSSAWAPSVTCRGTEFGELQLAMWRTQFTALRDGDRFFYAHRSAARRDQGVPPRRLPHDARRS